MKRTKFDTEWLERQILELRNNIADAQDCIERYEAMIEESQPIVKVAFLSSTAYDYIDGTDEGLKVGDLVNAGTRYSSRNAAVVVQVGGPRTYHGTLSKITEITSR